MNFSSVYFITITFARLQNEEKKKNIVDCSKTVNITIILNLIFFLSVWINLISCMQIFFSASIYWYIKYLNSVYVCVCCCCLGQNIECEQSDNGQRGKSSHITHAIFFAATVHAHRSDYDSHRVFVTLFFLLCTPRNFDYMVILASKQCTFVCVYVCINIFE